MYTVAGTCPKCGAPIYVPSNWNAVTPPPTEYTCSCRFGPPPHTHCWCRQEIMPGDGDFPHAVCCKCGERQALGYSIKIDSAGAVK